MKKIILIVFCALNFTAISQNLKRFEVKGRIIVESNDLHGITIFNATSNKGVVTDEKGEFTLAVRLNDIIEVSALQFQNIKFEVNKAIVTSKQMKIFLIEEINKLDEIIISTNKLTGNLETDISTTTVFNPKLDALYFGIKNKETYDFKADNKSAVTNIAVNSQKQNMINGLNIINVVDQILLPLFRSGVKNKDKSGIPDVPVESIKYYLGSEFLIDNFGIPEHRVEDFIRYVEGNNFDFSLLNYGNEMEFLQLLHDKSLLFLNKG